METLIESLVCLIQKLNVTESNSTKCRELSRKYRPVLVSTDEQKHNDIRTHIKSTLVPVLDAHRNEIINKDFGFLKEGVLIFDDVDIGTLYINVLDSDDTDKLDSVSNELLYLFYQIASDDDRKLIDEKHRKKNTTPPKTKKKAAEPSTPNVAKHMENILSKNKHKLKRAEKDPTAIPEVIDDFLKNNSKDMTGMLLDMMKGMGLDPSKM